MLRQPFLKDAKETVGEIREYIRRSRYALLLLGFFLCLVHGDKLFCANNGIDTEQLIYMGESFYDGWLGIGRQGLVFLKGLLGLKNYNPYFASLLLLLFSVTACGGFTFLFEYVRKQQGDEVEKLPWRWLLAAFGMLAFVHPVMTEQYYFTLQGAEVALSFNLLAVSLLCAHKWAEKGSCWWIVPAVGLSMPVFGVYQAMVPLYISAGAVLCCLHGWQGGRQKEVKKEIGYACHLAAVFILGFVLNQLITILFFTRSRYLSGQIQWDITDVSAGIRRLLSHMRDVAAGGGGVFYFRSFLWLAAVLGLLVFFHIIRRQKSPGLRIWNFLLLCAVYGGPFYLTVVMGERPVIRGQIVLPFTMGYMAYLSGVLLLEAAGDSRGKDREKSGDSSRERSSGRTGGRSGRVRLPLLSAALVLAGICILAVWQETAASSRLYYSEKVRYEGDLRLAGNISRDIQEFTGEYDFAGTVVFIGKRESAENHCTVTGDVMGHSLFAWDTLAEPAYYHSSRRILGFLHCMGIAYEMPDEIQTAQAALCAEQMPCYPAKGSIAWCGKTLVVKLSEE